MPFLLLRFWGSPLLSSAVIYVGHQLLTKSETYHPKFTWRYIYYIKTDKLEISSTCLQIPVVIFSCGQQYYRRLKLVEWLQIAEQSMTLQPRGTQMFGTVIGFSLQLHHPRHYASRTKKHKKHISGLMGGAEQRNNERRNMLSAMYFVPTDTSLNRYCVEYHWLILVEIGEREQ